MDFSNTKFSLKEKIEAFLKYVINIIVMNILKLFWIIPVKKNSILYLSFDGKQYSDSPKYLCDYISEHFNDKEIIWAFISPEKFDWIKNNGYKIVNRYSSEFFFVILTAKIIITNNHIATYIPIRKEQILINTWHGGAPMKTVGFAEKKKFYITNTFLEYKMKSIVLFCQVLNL